MTAPARPRRLRRALLAPLALLAVVGAACAPMSPTVTTPVPQVERSRYLGTWYEIASVKQFFSVGLVNTKAVYSLNPDGTVRVENSGDFLVDGGPLASIVGAAFPLDSTNARLNVSFAGPPSADGLGNYWIVDLDPDYQWAIVSDPTGLSGFILSRTQTVSPELRAELLQRAAAKGVNVANITETPQFGA